MRKIIKKIIIIVLMVFLGYGIVSSTVENIVISVELEKFKKDAILDEDKSTENTKYYKVKSQNQEEKESFTYYDGIYYPGVSGDILINLNSPLPNIPILNEIIGYFFGGHAAVVSKDYEDDYICLTSHDLIETRGNDKDKINEVTSIQNYFMKSSYTNSFIGLRLDISSEELNIFLDNLIDSIGIPYNYSFIFNTKKTYYCTDLISDNLLKVNKKYRLNYDYLITSVQDLFMSKHTYIFMYKYTYKNIEYIYYLG